ncbi:MAG: DUF6178 family protein, partial [Desulfobacterales bacterium]|nr:DUF6178 family protein [Desulfobacterales bacterium]
MSDTVMPHQLANLARKALKLRETRREILQSEGQQALDMILEAPSPATLIQSFPEQDLYYLMHKVGIHDFTPVLSRASSQQWEYILDVEVWDDDRLNTIVMAQAFGHLFKADPHRLLRWTLKEKPEFLEFFLFHHMEMVVREHDEPPPSDHEDYITLDDKFYFRFPAPPPGAPGENDGDEGDILPDTPPEETRPHEDTPELIENMLRSLAEMDLSVFHGLLLETTALLPSEAEEEQYRQKNIRLAEKGFEPPHEAIGIYQPVRSGTLRKRPDMGISTPAYDPEIPLPPQFFTAFIDGEDLFTAALGRVDEVEKTFVFQSELAALINKIISADRVKLRKRETVRDVMTKATAYLSLGLEVIADGEATPDRAASLIRTYY